MGFQGQIIETKRSLGQNFFINKNLAKQISEIVLGENPAIIVEIGPGTGSFTQFFVQENSRNLLLIEKDDTLARELKKEYPSVEIVNKDFLEWDFQELEQYKDKRILFFGSLPYNVSKKIIKKVISSKYFNTNSYFIIQKEVAQKYTNLQPNNSVLSVYTKLFSDSKKLLDISPESFKPRPKVNSSLVRFSPKDVDLNIDKDNFLKFLHNCFRQPRKTLKNSLKGSYTFNNQEVDKLLSRRPQHLSLDEFLFLYSNIK
jgi:16S rRNA (adenine1518-N6/adenine1519-N6)-dimethyltransferase